jgi:hypothetical protein
MFFIFFWACKSQNILWLIWSASVEINKGLCFNEENTVN